MIFVTVGTHEQQFNRLVGYMDKWAAEHDEEVIMQVGFTNAPQNCRSQKIYDQEAYADPSWEYVLGVEKSPTVFKIDGSTGTPMSLNYGQRPYKGNTKYHAKGDKRVIMFVDRGNNAQGEGGPVKYKVRSNANLSSVGYYSAATKFGRLTQNGW